MNNRVKKAESRSLTRAVILLALAFIIAMNTILQFNETSVSISASNISWIIMVILAALNLSSLPFSLCAKPMGTLMNDETTQHHRLKSLAAGFWMGIAASLAIFIITSFVPVSGIDVAHIIVATALVSALVTFSTLELKAAR